MYFKKMKHQLTMEDIMNYFDSFTGPLHGLATEHQQKQILPEHMRL